MSAAHERSGSRGGREIRSDAELLQAGTGEAFAALVQRYARLIHSVALGILRDAGEAEDVTQDVLFEIYRKADQYDPGRGTVRVWMLQYAYHGALRRKMTLRRRAAYAGAPLDQVLHLVDRRRDGALTREESRWVIQAGLARLPERQRVTLELSCFQGLSLHDIASRLGVSIGCARHYYYRGLERLRAWANGDPGPRRRVTVTAGRSSRRRHSASAADTTGDARAPVHRQLSRV